MRRNGWYIDEDAEQMRWTYEDAVRAGFWRTVDSQPGVYSEHRGECPTVQIPYRGEVILCGDWPHVRGDGCIASKSDRERCSQPTVGPVPFCDFHFSNAWALMRAFVNEEREEEMGRIEEFRRDRYYASHAMDAAMVRDAKRQLAQSSERVYFFAAGDAVKIGRSINPEKRVRSLAGTKAPDDVDVRTGSLLGTIPGGCNVESELHRRFAFCRLTGEWFDLTEIRGDLDELIAEYASEAVA